MNVKGEVLLQLFKQRQVKNWDQNVSRVNFSLFIDLSTKLGLMQVQVFFESSTIEISEYKYKIFSKIIILTFFLAQ